MGEALKTPSRRMKAENVIRIVQTVLAAAVAAFAISVVVAGHWWETPAPPPPPPPTVDVKAMTGQVITLLRDQWRTGPSLKEYGITVDDDLTLINTGLNKYDGLASVHTRKGTQQYVSLTVTADPTGSMFYSMDLPSMTGVIATARDEQSAGE